MQPRREPDTDKPYLRAATYSSDQAALQAYTRAQASLFSSDCDLSAYRIRYENVPHVVVLGSQPPADLDKKITTILSTGHDATLPTHIVETLAQRRSQAKRIGPWVEGHYRPGKPT